MVKYLELTLVRALNIDACTVTRPRTRVYAKVFYKNAIHTTTRVLDMGQNPVFQKDGTHVCHFDYENESEFISLHLFNWNNTCIGKSKLHFSELTKLGPEQAPEEKKLPVMITTLGGYQKPFGELIVTVQIKNQRAVGTQGNLTVELKEGNIKGLTSLMGSKTTKMQAKLTYKHTKLESGFLKGSGNVFMWHGDNKFTFIINSFEASDEVEIEVFNGTYMVGECKIQTSLLITGEEDPGADPRAEVTRTADLLVKNKKVGSIKVAATFSRYIDRRYSYPQDPSPRPSWQEPHQQIHPHHAHHRSIYTEFAYQASPSSSLPQSPRTYHQPQTRTAYESSAPSAPPAPPVMHPQMHPGPGQPRMSGPQAHAHGAPPTREEKKIYFENEPHIRNFVNNYH